MPSEIDNKIAWQILNRIFRDGDFYIDTGFVHPQDGEKRTRLCIDGTDYGATDEEIEWLEKTFYASDQVAE